MCLRCEVSRYPIKWTNSVGFGIPGQLRVHIDYAGPFMGKMFNPMCMHERGLQ